MLNIGAAQSQHPASLPSGSFGVFHIRTGSVFVAVGPRAFRVGPPNKGMPPNRADSCLRSSASSWRPLALSLGGLTFACPLLLGSRGRIAQGRHQRGGGGGAAGAVTPACHTVFTIPKHGGIPEMSFLHLRHCLLPPWTLFLAWKVLFGSSIHLGMPILSWGTVLVLPFTDESSNRFCNIPMLNPGMAA